ncbi:MAG: histidine kinase N-terminal 7TM domain-containing protein [Bacteroidota bacterium]
MNLIFNSIAWILFITFLTASGVAVFSYLKGYSRGHRYFTLMMVMIAEWALAAMMESAAPTISAKIFWSSVEYIGACTCAVFFLKYALGFVKIRSRWLLVNFHYFWIVPAMIIMLAFTNDHHHLVWIGFEWSPAGNNILTYHHGLAFFTMISYSLGLVLLGLVFIATSLPKIPATFRSQAKFVMAASIFPFFATLCYALGISPLQGLDITVISFVITGLVLLVGISRYGIFNILPLARHQITEIMQDGVLITDSAFNIIFNNPAAVRLLNLDADQYFSDLRKFDWLYNYCNLLISEPEKDVELQAGEKSKRWFSISVNRILDNEGTFKGNLIVLRDITTRKTLETETRNLVSELHQSQKELMELNAQKDKLMSIIAHDLRTPFHQILSFARMLSEDIEIYSPEEVKSMADGILEAGEHGAEILEDLLAWARSQRNSTEVTASEIQPVRILEEIIPVFAMATKDKGINFSIMGDTEIMVNANKNMLSIVFRNLIANAVKFSHPGGKIDLLLKKGTGLHSIEVKDSGIGIPEPDIPKLFNIDIKYTRTGTNGESGTGLGLILCKDLITRNNGELSVDSTLGVGSTFIVRLPATIQC